MPERLDVDAQALSARAMQINDKLMALAIRLNAELDVELDAGLGAAVGARLFP